MLKYSNNPVFWTSALVIVLAVTGVNMRNSVQALNAVALFFLVWLGFRLYRNSYARRQDLFLPRPDGVCVSGPEQLAVMPYLYLLTVVLISLVLLVFAWNWPAFWSVLVIAILGGLLCWRQVK